MFYQQIAHFLFLILVLSPVSTFATVYARNNTPVYPDLYEAGVEELQQGLSSGLFTSVNLVTAYFARMDEVNSQIHAIIEKNPSALAVAAQLDHERHVSGPRGPLHGIPILVKDLLDTEHSDGMNTTAGSYALLDSVVAKDATIVQRLKAAGAIILGKANLSEWAHIRGLTIPDAWSARGGQGTNPYYPDGGTCGSSTGPSAAAAVGLATVTIGTDTGGSISCPAGYHNVVGIKPTVGLTSRTGAIGVSPWQDTIGPIGRSVTDATLVLQAIAGRDPTDNFTLIQPIPVPDYSRALNPNALRGARIGVPRLVFTNDTITGNLPYVNEAFEVAIEKIRSLGATVVDPANLPSAEYFVDIDPQLLILLIDFKIQIKKYLSSLIYVPTHVMDLADIIQFNNDHPELEKPTPEYSDQTLFMESEATNGHNSTYWSTLAANRAAGGLNGIDAVLKHYNLDALILPAPGFPQTSPAAYVGYPMVTVPMSFYPPDTPVVEEFPGIYYPAPGIPLGLAFIGTAFSESKLISLAYSYEQATKIRLQERAYPAAIPTTQLPDVIG